MATAQSLSATDLPTTQKGFATTIPKNRNAWRKAVAASHKGKGCAGGTVPGVFALLQDAAEVLLVRLVVSAKRMVLNTKDDGKNRFLMEKSDN